MTFSELKNGWLDIGPGPYEIALVLGAGASAHLGFPLGAELVSRIQEAIGSPNSQHYSELVSMKFGESLIEEFREALNGYHPDSIDDFLGDKRQFAKIGRAVIAQQLIQYESSKKLEDSKSVGWYRWALKATLKSLEKNKYPPLIVTFNYDRSLDQFLAQAMTKRSTTLVSPKERLPKIFHVHGALGRLPFFERGSGEVRPYSSSVSAEEIFKASTGIRVIHEIENDYGIDMALAQQAVAAANRVIFLGFGYGDLNLHRLAIADRKTGQWPDTRVYQGTAVKIKEARRREIIQASSNRLVLDEGEKQIEEYLENLNLFS